MSTLALGWFSISKANSGPMVERKIEETPQNSNFIQTMQWRQLLWEVEGETMKIEKAKRGRGER